VTPHRTRLGATALTALAVLPILVATLRPVGGELPHGWNFALIEGDEGIAEILQNVLLFIPLGVALALGNPRTLRNIAAGALLSLAVEFTQQWIPGRDPSVGDLVFNTLGTAVGVLLVRTAPTWLWPPAGRAAWLSLASAALAATVWLGTGWLLQPLLPPANAVAIRNPDVGHDADLYAGHVLAVSGRLGVAEPLRITATAGTRSRRLAPLVLMEEGSRRTLIGVDRETLVLRNYSRSRLLGLDKPDLRARGALAGVAPGDTFTVTAWTDGKGPAFCLALDEKEWEKKWCGLGYTIGAGWRLIFFRGHFPPLALGLLDALWVAGTCLGVGFWARRHWATRAALGLVALALLVGPGLVGLLATPITEIAGAVAGVGLGWWAQRRYRAVSALSLDG